MGSLAQDVPLPFQVLVIGGSYAGLSATLNLLDICSGREPRCGRGGAGLPGPRDPIDVEITIVDERDGFFHLIGAPLAMASDEYAARVWVKFGDIAALRKPNVRVIQGTAKKIDPATRTATIAPGSGSSSISDGPETELKYDFLVAASGLRRVWPVVPQSLTRKQYLAETGAHVRAVSRARHGVLVVGGGAVGIEMAAELKLMRPGLKVTLAHSRDRLLSSEGLPDDCKDVALELLREAGVEVLTGHRLAGQVEVDVPVEDGAATTKAVEATFGNGHAMLVDKVVIAMSRSVPSTNFLPADTLDEEGYLKVQPNLIFPPEMPNATSHFGAGDLVRWSGIKRCGGAMYQGHIVAANMHQLMLRQRLAGGHAPVFIEMPHFPPMIGLAVGSKAVSSSPPEGTKHGEDVLELFFGDDLGFTICWNYLRLGGDSKV